MEVKDMKRTLNKQKNRVLCVILTAVLLLGLIPAVGNQISPGSYEASAATVGDFYGTTRSALVAWLTSHESDSYYLGTIYKGGDYRNPNGDSAGAYGGADTPGVAAMNCAGFVWHAMHKAGATSFPSGWSGEQGFYENPTLEYYEFSSKEELLASGKAQKGDLLYAIDPDVYAPGTAVGPLDIIC
jgi:hypothetical protein